MQKLLDSWRTRKLTLFGKVQVIKSLALPKLIFSATNTCIPSTVCKTINDLMFSFIWNGKDKIKRNVVIGHPKYGGLGIPDIEIFFKSLSATWINKLYMNSHTSWAAIAFECFKICGSFDLILNTNFTDVKEFPILSKLPLFYQQVVLSYNTFKSRNKPICSKELAEQLIWGNKLFSLYNKKTHTYECLFFKSWIEEGIIFVKDIPFNNGKIGTASVASRIKDQRLLMQIYIIINALRPYKEMLINISNFHFENRNEFGDLHIGCKSKLMYSKLINTKL